VTDADLIRAAYERWGRDCPKRLVGAFAFALWDVATDRLFCARDHAGIRPFYYANCSDVFVFGSELSAVRAHDAVGDDVDDVAVGEFLTGLPLDPDRTFAGDVARLPPGHSLVVSEDGVAVERYWQPDPSRTLESRSVTEYVAGFRERFERAVRCRQRSPDDRELGAAVSGGLDSSAIACTANRCRDAPLPTVSLRFGDVPASDESAYFEAVYDHGEFDPTIVDVTDRTSPMASVDDLLSSVGAPFAAPNLYLHRELHRSAAEQGVSVFLDGYGGDQVVSHGFERFPALARSLRLRELTAVADDYAARHDQSTWRVLLDRAALPLVPARARELWHRATGESDPVARRSVAVDPVLADRTGLRVRIRSESESDAVTAREQHAASATGGFVTQALEAVDAVAATFGTQPRYPFYDRRLLEYCLALPRDVILRNGQPRWVLRQAVGDTLPSAVRNRDTKVDLGQAFKYGLRTRDEKRLRRTLVDGGELPDALDMRAVQSAFERFGDGTDEGVVANLWRPALLTRWCGLR
jgi:asparagine synthase (glutamine-hydrolysing)